MSGGGTELFVHWTFPDGATRPVGTVREVGGAGIEQFTYAGSWLASGFAIGEGLPLTSGPQLPPGGASTFGVLDDAGPDAWGRLVLARSRPAADISTPLGRLAAVADEPRQGALRFSRAPEGPYMTEGAPSEIGDVLTLKDDAAALVRGEADRAAMRRLFAGSTSQGGARPKTALRDGPRLVMAKFPSELDTYDVEACEALALGVGRAAGLSVPGSRLMRLDEDHSILIVERFDRVGGRAPGEVSHRSGDGRIGYQSMRTAMGLGEFEAYTYEAAARTARYLCGAKGVRAVVGAAALAICVHSIDDHPRNAGFLREEKGWAPAPLFDVVPYPEEQEGAPLQAGESGRSLEQMLDMDWGLPRAEVVSLVTGVAQVARGMWERAPREVGLDAEVAENCGEFMESACDFDTVLDGAEPRY